MLSFPRSIGTFKARLFEDSWGNEGQDVRKESGTTYYLQNGQRRRSVPDRVCRARSFDFGCTDLNWYI